MIEAYITVLVICSAKAMSKPRSHMNINSWIVPLLQCLTPDSTYKRYSWASKSVLQSGNGRVHDIGEEAACYLTLSKQVNRDSILLFVKVCDGLNWSIHASEIGHALRFSRQWRQQSQQARVRPPSHIINKERTCFFFSLTIPLLNLSSTSVYPCSIQVP